MTLGAILLASKVWDDQAGYRWFGRGFGSSNKAQAVGDITSLVLCAKETGEGVEGEGFRGYIWGCTHVWGCDPTVDHSYVNFFSCSHSMECRLLSDIEGHSSGGHVSTTLPYLP